MKTAFVFSGEGARGAYQAGILRALAKQGIEADAVYGTSSGALNATGYSYLGTERLAEVWLGIHDVSQIFKGNGIAALWRTGAYNAMPLHKMVSNIVGKNDPWCPVTVTRVNLLNGGLDYAVDGEMAPDEFVDAVVASASLPGLVEPHEAQWVDGGIRVITPLRKAIRDGADRLCVILGSPPTIQPWEELPPLVNLGPFKPFRAAMAAFRSLEIALHQIMMSDIRLARKRNHVKGYRNLDIQVFGPPHQLYGMLDFARAPSTVLLGERNYVEYDEESL